MRITVIGLPSARVQQAIMNARAASTGFDEKPRITWVQDVHKIAGMGSLVVPTIKINDEVKVEGRIPSVYEFETWIEQEMEEEFVA